MWAILPEFPPPSRIVRPQQWTMYMYHKGNVFSNLFFKRLILYKVPLLNQMSVSVMIIHFCGQTKTESLVHRCILPFRKKGICEEREDVWWYKKRPRTVVGHKVYSIHAHPEEAKSRLACGLIRMGWTSTTTRTRTIGGEWRQ